uniref:Uncharacterized protein n=1 Tax=Nelumbo nucifera TaxID=4432 RepID=A0A822YYG5_NELNU|nr:TPA_asm: hypothetical protein HUJ06_006416 [Nelumbo nucifera]
MEKRKPRGSTGESAIVKAAAWAWYQHGAGSERKSVREYDFTRTHPRPARPSRYKLEAIRLAGRRTMEGSALPSPTPSPSQLLADNSLLDPYEIQRITQQLDHLIESSNAKFCGDSPVKDQDHHQKKAVLLLECYRSGKKMNKKLNGGGALSLRGSGGEVVEAGVLCGRRLQLPKHVSVVGLSGCRPRANHAK